MKKLLNALLITAATLLPLPALAVQYDGIKNLSPLTRNYTLTNPTGSIAINPGQTIIIQDTQYTSSSALISDVQHGYLSQYVIGSPNSTQTVYQQPVTINSSSNAAAGLLVAESSGTQPGISVTQTNSGDLIDLYQSGAPELLFNNNLFHLFAPAAFDASVTVGNVLANGGQIKFGSSGSSSLSYVTATGSPGVSNFNANTFGFTNGPISTSSTNGYYVGTYQLLGTDNSGNNTLLRSQNNTFTFYGPSSVVASLTPQCFVLGGSCFGQNTTVAGTFAANSANFSSVGASQVTAQTIAGQTDLTLQPGNTTSSLIFKNSSNVVLGQIKNDGSYTLANGTVSSDAAGNATSRSVLAQFISVLNAGQFQNVNNYTYLTSVANGGFEVRNSAGTADLLKLSDNGNSTLGGNITFTPGGGLFVNTLSASGTGSFGGNLTATGSLAVRDVYASRDATSGYAYFGSNGAHSIGFDGNAYQFSSGPVVINGLLNVANGNQISTGQVNFLASGTANSSSQYASSFAHFINSQWNGSAVVANTGNIYLDQNGNFVVDKDINTTKVSASTLQGSTINTQNILNTGNNTLYIQTNNNSSPIVINGNAVTFAVSQPVNVTGVLSVSNTSAGNRLYSGTSPSSAVLGTNVGDFISDEGNGNGSIFFGNNRANYLAYDSFYGTYAFYGGNVIVPQGNLTVNSPNGIFTYNLTTTGTANMQRATSYGETIAHTYYAEQRFNPTNQSFTIGFGRALAGPSSQVYDIVARWNGADWLNGSVQLTGFNATWNDNGQVTEPDSGQVGSQEIELAGTATGGQSPQVTLAGINGFKLNSPPGYAGLFTLMAIPR